ncbi:MAG TPA: DNA replication and repair protein RecF [Ignavibacteria bacterium]|nr:DNA replication and repair protein RecF [Ignavibacteria bacterium]
MVLKKLFLKNFRNYIFLEAAFNGKFNFIYGNNGNGKTNILEAISLVSLAKSFIGSGESDCVKQGEKSFIVKGDYVNDLDNDEIVSVEYDSDAKKKTFFLNKEKITSVSSELFGKFPVVYLTPHSLNISYGNPSDRRKFFDILISQTSRVYLDRLKELNRLLQLKNALLKDYVIFKRYSNDEFNSLFNTYNEKLVEVSANITFKRLNFLREFIADFEKSYALLVKDGGKGEICYYSEFIGEIDVLKDKELSVEDLESVYKKRLAEFKKEETGRVLSLVGPQRDDYVFKIAKSGDVFDLKNHGSQGEHKTFIVAVKLAEYEYLKSKKNTDPVLLLDDILSELDENRVSQIISHLKDYGQIFLTTIDRNYLNNIKQFYKDNEISVFKVTNGEVVQE